MVDYIIELKNVDKKLKGLSVFHSLNFKCEAGKIIGITGANGVGKSVLFKIISGLYKPDKGEVCVYGEDIVSNRKIPDDIGALIEEPGFIPNYSGFNNLRYLASIRGKITETEIDKVLDIVGLSENKHQKVKTYSLGMKKKLGIAQAIMEQPRLLLLDEPMNALDKRSVENMRNLFLKLAAEQRTTILIASHNEEDIHLLCEEVYLIEDGTCCKI